MANWHRKLRLQPEWDKASEHEITVQALAAVVAKRMRALTDFRGDLAYLNDDRDEIADEFEGLADDAQADFDDFDSVMERLYDWGDTQIGGQFFDAQKVCWIDRSQP